MQVLAFNIGSDYQLGNKRIGNVFPTFGNLFSTILFNVYVIAGIIFLFLLIFGGLSLIIGAGSQNSDKMANGQKAITAAIGGFIVIFLSYFIIQVIEVITGVNIIESGF